MDSTARDRQRGPRFRSLVDTWFVRFSIRKLAVMLPTDRVVWEEYENVKDTCVFVQVYAGVPGNEWFILPCDKRDASTASCTAGRVG